MEVIDRDGLDGLSLQSVARQLGVSAPSLYHHFRDKEELLTEVARAIIIKIGQEQSTWSDDWEERVVELALATRRVTLRHPNAGPLSLQFFPRKLTLPTYEASLTNCPYPPDTHLIVLEAIEKFTYGSSLFAAAAEVHHSPAMPTIDAERFPRLAKAIEVAPDDETIFAEALRALLAGLRARYGKKREPSAKKG